MGNSTSSSSGGGGGKVTSQDKAILDLKVQRDKLKQYQKRINLSLDSENDAAKRALAAGEKSKALSALRQRKHQQTLLTKTDAQLMNLQELLSTIEFAQIQSQVISSLQKGSQVLRELQREMPLEKVHSVMDEAREGQLAQREIDEALMSQMSPEEEEAVQAEFAQLQEEIGIKEAQKLAPTLPSAPSTEPVQQQHEEEEENRVPTRQRQREEDLMLAMVS